MVPVPEVRTKRGTGEVECLYTYYFWAEGTSNGEVGGSKHLIRCALTIARSCRLPLSAMPLIHASCGRSPCGSHLHP